MHAFLHFLPFLFGSALIVLCAYWRGRVDERRTRLDLESVNVPVRYEPFTSPRVWNRFHGPALHRPPASLTHYYVNIHQTP